ncbi:MAG: CPBP family intramembrane metalloprotease [Chloroflexota bacterium]|nr:CPBP family intramembrane metalloprotease [Chloroflexota bacterium]
MTPLEAILTAAVYGGILLIIYGVVYWAHRAQTDRSAFVGLYLLLGFPGGLLALWGFATLVVNGESWGWRYLLVGLGLALPLVKPLRRLVASFTRIDPSSSVDMVGLSALLAALSLLALVVAQSNGNAIDPETMESPNSIDLLAQAVFLSLMAYILVGVGITRSFRQATERLGLALPGPRTVFIALGAVLVGLVFSAVGGALTAQFQPDLYDQVENVTTELTAEVQNPVGALLLGITAGVGEELLFRGAVQPRFGLLLTSLTFAFLHAPQYGFSFVILGLFGVAVLLGVERMRYGTVAAIITHAGFNTLAVLAETYL